MEITHNNFIPFHPTFYGHLPKQIFSYSPTVQSSIYLLPTSSFTLPQPILPMIYNISIRNTNDRTSIEANEVLLIIKVKCMNGIKYTDDALTEKQYLFIVWTLAFSYIGIKLFYRMVELLTDYVLEL